MENQFNNISVLEVKEKATLNELVKNYKSYIKNPNFKTKKIKIFFRDRNLFLTKKQIEILRLISRGYSNSRISEHLERNENSVKLFIHRLIKKISDKLSMKIDRFSIILIAQELFIQENNHNDLRENLLIVNQNMK